MRKISDKQLEKLRLWRKVTRNRMLYLEQEYGKAICEWCGSVGYKDPLGSPFDLHGHHIDGNRNHNTEDNCYCCHNKCHPPKYIHVQQEDFQGKVKNGK